MNLAFDSRPARELHGAVRSGLRIAVRGVKAGRVLPRPPRAHPTSTLGPACHLGPCGGAHRGPENPGTVRQAAGGTASPVAPARRHPTDVLSAISAGGPTPQWRTS